jgi:type III secretion protein J
MMKHLKLLLLAVLLILGLGACSNRVELMAAMPEGEANEVMAALQKAGIEVRKTSGKDGMVGLTLEATEVGRAVDLLRSLGLPRERFTGMGQVFKKEGLISSPLEERARYLYALSQQLASSISKIDGVVAADVHVVLPERGSPGEQGVPASAAVFIKHHPAYNIDTVLPQIRKLVASSIPALTPERVTIVQVSAQANEGAGSAVPAKAPTTEQTTTHLVPIVLTLTALLLGSLGVCGFLLWRFWWPSRLPRQSSAAVESSGSDL